LLTAHQGTSMEVLFNHEKTLRFSCSHIMPYFRTLPILISFNKDHKRLNETGLTRKFCGWSTIQRQIIAKWQNEYFIDENRKGGINSYQGYSYLLGSKIIFYFSIKYHWFPLSIAVFNSSISFWIVVFSYLFVIKHLSLVILSLGLIKESI